MVDNNIYTAEVKKKGFGYIEHFEWTRQPVYINGNVMDGNVIAGPLQGLKAGKNRIKVW